MRWGKYALNTLFVLAMVSSVATAAIVVKRELFRTVSSVEHTGNTGPRAVENWESLTREGRLIGPADAALVIYEFADYQCPACRQFQFLVDTLRAEYPDDLAVSYHYVPLSYHKRAYASARAAECAADQGRFEGFHNALFANFPMLDTTDMTRLASEAQVPDLGRFVACASLTDPVQRIEWNRSVAADSLRIPGTPSVIVNGKLYTPAPLPTELRAMIREASQRKAGRRE